MYLFFCFSIFTFLIFVAQDETKIEFTTSLFVPCSAVKIPVKLFFSFCKNVNGEIICRKLMQLHPVRMVLYDVYVVIRVRIIVVEVLKYTFLIYDSQFYITLCKNKKTKN